MSRLTSHQRPSVDFDPTDKEHRKWYNEFLQTASWSHCPVRFTVQMDGDEGNTQAIIQRKIAQHYLDKEFNTKATVRAKMSVAA